jgi:8-oxo-dGTP pyrophosphatase MutT (NUDIX family)
VSAAGEDRPHARPSATVAVVAVVATRDGRYLLGLRPRAKRHGGLWEFPGGKLHDGESHLDAARRELDEEMDLRVVSLGARLLTVRDAGSPFVIDFHEATVEGSPVAREHEAVGWFTLDALREMPLAPADARFVDALTSGAR